MPARSKARKRAVDIVFESDLRSVPISETLAAWQERDDPPVQEHAARLAAIVADRLPDIDHAVDRRLVGWDLDRVARVDRAVLRVAVAELLWVDDVPDAVVVDEAVELAKSLSTDESPAFVNGVLGRVVTDKQELLAAVDGDRPGETPDAGGLPNAGGASDADGASGLGVEDAPRDEVVGEPAGTQVVDHGE